MSANFDRPPASDFFRCAADSGHAVVQVRSVVKGQKRSLRLSLLAKMK